MNDLKHKSDLLIPPKVNNAFSKNKALDNTLVHRRLAHKMEERADKMAKLDIILDLPKRNSKRYQKQKYRYLICWKASTVNLPKGITTNTDNIRPSELIHMDFYFIEETSIENLHVR